MMGSILIILVAPIRAPTLLAPFAVGKTTGLVVMEQIHERVLADRCSTKAPQTYSNLVETHMAFRHERKTLDTVISARNSA
jgi:hypothetical protein